MKKCLLFFKPAVETRTGIQKICASYVRISSSGTVDSLIESLLSTNFHDFLGVFPAAKIKARITTTLSRDLRLLLREDRELGRLFQTPLALGSEIMLQCPNKHYESNRSSKLPFRASWQKNPTPITCMKRLEFPLLAALDYLNSDIIKHMYRKHFGAKFEQHWFWCVSHFRRFITAGETLILG